MARGWPTWVGCQSDGPGRRARACVRRSMLLQHEPMAVLFLTIFLRTMVRPERCCRLPLAPCTPICAGAGVGGPGRAPPEQVLFSHPPFPSLRSAVSRGSLGTPHHSHQFPLRPLPTWTYFSLSRSAPLSAPPPYDVRAHSPPCLPHGPCCACPRPTRPRQALSSSRWLLPPLLSQRAELHGVTDTKRSCARAHALFVSEASG